MPAPDDLVDQVEQQINNNNIAIAQDRQRLERLVEERLANADNRLEVQGQPLIAENPQHRPLFERRPLDVPVLDDLPPNERPIGQQPESSQLFSTMRRSNIPGGLTQRRHLLPM
ncbi:hypothetical protein DL89DRAFT_94441 [Linderina pennispora]|uniref:Uncharacterized protein n=1 Tax=Linderina pennispora TaxID=61395 RepID=A0A1Y1VQ66_9FUNG|nr:uncharacterized protein DL89DRAFT_94441 [Linderina pennispora]ORX63417.1 hypothetical protein DL89DRAFT_94441 [Linderina pennispora]